MQIVLVGQPELDRKLKEPHLRQLEHRIVFSYRLPTLERKDDLLTYICFRLSSAGYKKTHDSLFSPKAIKLLLKESRGIPRLINVLCHKALLITYGYNKDRVESNAVRMAALDTDCIAGATAIDGVDYLLKATFGLLLVVTLGIAGYLLFG